jgi:hypothetical protein
VQAKGDPGEPARRHEHLVVDGIAATGLYARISTQPVKLLAMAKEAVGRGSLSAGLRSGLDRLLGNEHLC